jgi:hypothetical protein
MLLCTYCLGWIIFFISFWKRDPSFYTIAASSIFVNSDHWFSIDGANATHITNALLSIEMLKFDQNNYQYNHTMICLITIDQSLEIQNNNIYLLTGYEGIASLLSPRHWLLTEAKPRSIVRVEGTTNLLFPNTQSISILLYRKTLDS